MVDGELHIVFAERFDDWAVERMGGIGRVTILEACDQPSLTKAVADCDALLVRTRARVSRAMIEGAPRLKVIGRGGVGLENIDLEAAREHGVAVVYTPEAATEAVADLTVGMIISLERRVPWCDAMVRGGRFRQARDEACARELSELTIGIIGLGRIGKAVARRCRHGFGMNVLFNDIVEPGWLDFVATPMSKDELYERSDIVSIHVPLTAETRGLIDRSALSKFKKGSILINTARGAVVDGAALARALESGILAGAGLDVLDPEPLPADHPLLSAPNTLFTGHTGARTRGGLARMNAVVDDVIHVLRGVKPRFPA